jgi:S1-C subfamily serine protease
MQMKPIVHALEQARYPIRQIDTTQDFQTSRQFNVNQIPCFVMLVNGREVERQLGATSSESLQQMFERAKDEVQRSSNIRLKDRDPSPLPDGPQARGPVSIPPPSLRDQAGATNLDPPAMRGAPEPGEAASGPLSPLHASLLSASVRLSVEDPQGKSFGTGTIIDTKSGEALVITCGHLFRETQGKAPVKAELFDATGNGVHVVAQATGDVISYDLKRDIALVSIRVDRRVLIANVAPPKSPMERGDRVVSIGCSNGNDPTVMESRITYINKYQGPPNIEASGAPAIGRSGGGLFNMKGELIGICNNADPEGNEGLYAGLAVIQEELDKIGQTAIYAKNGEAAPAAAAGPGPSVVRGQVPSEITPLANETSASQASASHNLSKTEEAALTEIMKRAVSSEVIVIVRPKDAGGESEVIHLDSVSPDFIRELANRKKEAQATGPR